MMRKHRNALAILLLMAAVLPLSAQGPSQSDLTVIDQIKDEGFNHSQVMEIMSYLTDVYGPRLTNSPDIKQAAEWTTGKMKEWQLANGHPELWGPSFVDLTANRDEMVPRRPLPKTRPKRTPFEDPVIIDLLFLSLK